MLIDQTTPPETHPGGTRPVDAHAGSYRELLALAIPFILSSSFTTLQLFIDRFFITDVGKDAMAAVMPTVGYFWTPMALLQFTVGYVTVFVAQYCGAGRLHRVGPIVWQGLYLALLFGLLFPLLIPFVDAIITVSGHSAGVQLLERAYFRGLCFAALPMIVVAGVNAFFAGRQQSWTVLLINGVGALVNCMIAWPMISMRRADPEAAMFNAGLAAAIGSAVSALVGLVLVFQQKYEVDFRTRSGWRFDPASTRRLLYFGIPNGGQFFVEALAFTVFIILVGRISDAAGAASGITFTLNIITFLPTMGLAQAVEVLVGQRQGEDRPDIAAITTHRAAIVATIYMGLIAIVYCTLPRLLMMPFVPHEPNANWAEVAALIPILLCFVAVYTLADGANLVYAFALRGAGDTRFVTKLVIGLAWPIMVLPTWLLISKPWGLYAAWTAATAYVIALALSFWLRFRGGRWRTMKVIEPHVTDETEAATS